MPYRADWLYHQQGGLIAAKLLHVVVNSKILGDKVHLYFANKV